MIVNVSEILGQFQTPKPEISEISGIQKQSHTAMELLLSSPEGESSKVSAVDINSIIKAKGIGFRKSV